MRLSTEACEQIVGADSGSIPSDVTALLRPTLDRTKGVHHVGERAWSLRYGMDLAIHGLEREMSDRPIATDRWKRYEIVKTRPVLPNRSAGRLDFLFGAAQRTTVWRTLGSGDIGFPATAEIARPCHGQRAAPVALGNKN